MKKDDTDAIIFYSENNLRKNQLHGKQLREKVFKLSYFFKKK